MNKMSSRRGVRIPEGDRHVYIGVSFRAVRTHARSFVPHYLPTYQPIWRVFRTIHPRLLRCSVVFGAQ
ncbi:hypothetical protein Ae201684P_007242 [Aphanomyces euteiches]|uniref:Uncharacterized protein n=1 Tax=Aphanomyces euteiches TaxID=100861 RepID=A0A6G0X8P0_9STRA|nr:hypothetical protein Ae201684_007455 [Aphanomyces euteiches]KAH9101054.1 hypothetical protein Ae201684P_007242 [Aphanomyces euteiches]